MKQIEISKEQGMAVFVCAAVLAAAMALPIKEEKVTPSAAPVASFSIPESKLGENMVQLATPPVQSAKTDSTYVPTLTSILLGHGRPLAVIDGKAVHVGDISGAGKVTEINERFVLAGGRVLRLN